VYTKQVQVISCQMRPQVLSLISTMEIMNITKRFPRGIQSGLRLQLLGAMPPDPKPPDSHGGSAPCYPAGGRFPQTLYLGARLGKPPDSPLAPLLSSIPGSATDFLS